VWGGGGGGGAALDRRVARVSNVEGAMVSSHQGYDEIVSSESAALTGLP